ncbi:SDR family oxidoreductase [Sulfitobacter geojensis]|uniref:SDR family oxidoreductase n=1 Tax=Sulfitobacter geojensis TaxID=1342299 RepID=A0AAE2VZ25_9RHOB|nr:SDR family oxidoreductase [Sulfitobacter geojensis]MBM1689728.1 SDR family oxidoreductase [Sulfitobacter geojensis]MBM1693794.1 SDR family oxidoreductase [Sulfitobacter geojensis]MBM1705960.1 SDR family oxidoreductase [Sulfitobacter geojensis]MBM1710018.1 SDR family oxidoreductase [Sulfitobacter geojensis]MBM1714084.1 SDR family oxidoreductase [Sulfitobacter geojensis]
MDMQNKTVMITGASRGIGAEAARVFAKAGANVALLARSEAALNELVAEIGEAAIAIPCDVASYADMAAAVETTVQRFGGLDVLINNAGVIEPVSHLSEADPDAWGQVIDINLKGVFNGMRAALPVMKGKGGGSILTISSGAAHGAVEAWSHYCASKAAVHMLTKCVHLEEAEYGIRAIGLSPGTVATQMQREIKASGINPVSKLAWEDHIPADWPAKCLLWMCSAAADEYAGEEISLRDEGIRRAVGLS